MGLTLARMGLEDSRELVMMEGAGYEAQNL